jgi:hypothetical protein
VELEPGSFEDPSVARQGNGRGLCVVDEGRFVSGSSPLTLSLHDLDEMKTTLRINLSTDARHAIHTLAVWPFGRMAASHSALNRPPRTHRANYFTPTILN